MHIQFKKMFYASNCVFCPITSSLYAYHYPFLFLASLFAVSFTGLSFLFSLLRLCAEPP